LLIAELNSERVVERHRRSFEEIGMMPDAKGMEMGFHQADPWWSRLLRRFEDRFPSKQIAAAVDVDRNTAYNWLRGDTVPTIDILPLIFAQFPAEVVDAIETHLRSHRPARGSVDDDINRDGKTDERDAHEFMLRAAQADLSAISELAKRCDDGKLSPEEATEILEKIDEVMPQLQGAQRTLLGIVNRFSRRTA
jgi:transcriptional regulator with XRE-family HTH domain